jgi:hypothetical protein
MFDILSRHLPSLLFQPQCLICMGSPLGMFIPLQQELHVIKQHFRPFLPTQSAPAAAASTPEPAVDSHSLNRIPIVNIFHPNDPVASRLEPLLEPSAALISPAPCINSNRIISNSMLSEHGEIMRLITHVRSLAIQRMHGINWSDILAAGQFSSARLM